MLYTSGTTGRPKGVRLTHAALAATVDVAGGGVALARATIGCCTCCRCTTRTG